MRWLNAERLIGGFDCLRRLSDTFCTAFCSALHIGYGLAEMIIGNLQIVAFGDAVVMPDPRLYDVAGKAVAPQVPVACGTPSAYQLVG